MPQLFTNRTTNGNSTATEWDGGQATVYVHGTFDGAVITLQASFDNGATWIPLDNGVFTIATAVNLNLAARVQLRAVLSSAGAATSLTVGY
jgi:hypothetical protein